MGVDFENVAGVRVLGMSDVEIWLWPEYGARQKFVMFVKHKQKSEFCLEVSVLVLFYRHVRFRMSESAKTLSTYACAAKSLPGGLRIFSKYRSWDP